MTEKINPDKVAEYYKDRIIQCMMEYQSKNNINDHCVDHSLMLYDFLNDICPGYCTPVSGVVVYNIDDDLKFHCHCWVVVTKTQEILEPSYELFRNQLKNSIVVH